MLHRNMRKRRVLLFLIKCDRQRWKDRKATECGRVSLGARLLIPSDTKILLGKKAERSTVKMHSNTENGDLLIPKCLSLIFRPL